MRLWKALPSAGELGRLAAIGRVLAKHGVGTLAERWFRTSEGSAAAQESAPGILKAALPSARRVRLALEELGPSFVKLGQVMSTRADVFPPTYIDELKKLQDSVPPVPFARIREVLEVELRKPLTELFAALEPTPIAAASVAQVHLARLFTGEAVAVKVVRPGIARRIRQDVRLMYYLAERLERFSEACRILGLTNVVQEFERTVFRELDMLIEAGNIEKFIVNFQGVDEIHIPAVFWRCTTKSVLVMEHVDGVKMDQVAEIRARGVDPKEVALIGLRSFSRQLMEFGFFHADPHPGNTLVLADGRVSLIDFGIIGYLDEETMRQIANLFLGFADHDYDLVMEALAQAGIVSERTVDLAAFRSDLKDVAEAFYGRSLQHISVVDVYEQIMGLLFEHRIRLPRNLLLLLKTFIQTEALGKILGSDASLLEVTKPYARRLVERSYGGKKLFGHLDRDLRALAGYLKAMPKSVHDIARQLAAGKQRLELSHTGFERFDAQLDRGVNRLTVGLIVSASVIAASLVLTSTQPVLLFPVRFFGLQTLSVTQVLGLTGYTIATGLGLWLIGSILRSRRL
ncbi:MAG: AarF/ABC1/UbiB kinase family protein [Deltaproteobacteria bacterium]|nr:AarF/ABC1/UbiB kinase family protein [Deltaproteobacteria bacterium]